MATKYIIDPMSGVEMQAIINDLQSLNHQLLVDLAVRLSAALAQQQVGDKVDDRQLGFAAMHTLEMAINTARHELMGVRI
jgi:hypothetical protein